MRVANSSIAPRGQPHAPSRAIVGRQHWGAPGLWGGTRALETP